jgi:hypothetical protein
MNYRVKIWLAETTISVEYILTVVLDPSWSILFKIPMHFLLVSILAWVVATDTVLPSTGRVGTMKLKWITVPVVGRLVILVLAGVFDSVDTIRVVSTIATGGFHAMILWWIFELGKSKYSDVRFVCN